MTPEDATDIEHSPRETASAAPALTASLSQRLAGHGWHRNLVGQAGATVHRVHHAGEPDLYLKHGTGDAATALVDEMARLHWLAGKLPTPTLEHFEYANGQAWLLTRAVPGRTAYEWLVDDPGRGPAIAVALGQFLAQLHALPPSLCPFDSGHTLRLEQARQRLEAGLIDAEDFDDAREGWTPEDVWQAMTDLLPLAPDPVVTHGDYSLDNVLLDPHGRITGLIDLGRVGVADRYQDLAILWNCLEEFGPALQQAMLGAYGLAQVDEGKMTFHLCLDECF